MAVLKAYPSGSTEPVEWALAAESPEDVESLATKLMGSAPSGYATIPTATGWVQVDLRAYAAFEIVK